MGISHTNHSLPRVNSFVNCFNHHNLNHVILLFPSSRYLKDDSGLPFAKRNNQRIGELTLQKLTEKKEQVIHPGFFTRALNIESAKLSDSVDEFLVCKMRFYLLISKFKLYSMIKLSSRIQMYVQSPHKCKNKAKKASDLSSLNVFYERMSFMKEWMNKLHLKCNGLLL